MPLEIQIDHLSSGKKKEINIIIHGYSAVTSRKEYDELRNYILEAKIPGQVYLFYWKSGNWKIPVFGGLLPIAAMVVMRRAGGIGTTALAAVASGVNTAVHFRIMEKRAEALGRSLDEFIAKIPQSGRYPINLIGHSLGARAIHYALVYTSWRKEFNLVDCLFLAGACDLADDDWEDCLKEIKGKIFNAYSPKDNILVLAKAISTKDRIGRFPLPEHRRIQNFECTNYGHTDYWPNLSRVLDDLWPRYKQDV